MKDKKLAELYLISKGFRKAKGFAINTQEMNPNDYEEIFFEGESLNKAITDYFRIIKEFWIYEPSEGEQLMEDIWDAVEYAEEDGITFEDFKKNHLKLKKQNEGLKNEKI